MANQKIVTDEALSAFASDVKAEIANVSSPLAYKGTLGTGGTISTLPAASANNKGFAYVVITAGTYQGVVCAVSDVIASNGTAWDKIPQANSAETLPITTGSAVNTKKYIDDKTTFVKSASGSIVHITDGADNIPVKSIVSQIVAVQSGSGEKSPTNPYSISGFDSGIITRCGINLCDEVFETGDISFATGGNITGASWIRSKNYVPIVSGLTIYVKSAQNINIFFYDCNKAYLGNNNEGLKANIKNTEMTISSKARYFRIATNQTHYNNDISINYPSTDTQYHAYNGNTYTFAFGQTVYGGHFDNKGNLVVTNGFIVYDGSENWVYQAPNTFRLAIPSGAKPAVIPKNCNMFTPSLSGADNTIFFGTANMVITSAYFNEDINAFKSFLSTNNLKIGYELANPITLSITSQDIPTLLGENNIFSNCGDVEVDYYTSKSNDILEFIDSEIGKKNGTNIPIEANSQDSIKTYVDDEVSTINTSLSNKASKTEDTTITLASGYSLISSSCGKTDRLVHLNFNVEKSGGFSTGWQVIGTTEFKPNTLAYCPLWNVTNGVGNGEVRIDTDGTINFYVVTAGELRLNANIGYITD